MTHRPAIDDPPERKESLWLLLAAPAIWALHFGLAYGTASLWCAKAAGPDGDLGTARVLIAVYTVLALLALAFVARLGHRRHHLGAAERPHDDDSAADRHRFLGFTILVLAGLAAIAVVYAALPALFIGTCR